MEGQNQPLEPWLFARRCEPLDKLDPVSGAHTITNGIEGTWTLEKNRVLRRRGQITPDSDSSDDDLTLCEFN